ncbi:DUF4233 domain-containing protein [Jatrophihabitans sp. DSM 45814]
MTEGSEPKEKGAPDQAVPDDADWEPTEEDWEARRLKANRATRGGMAAILCLEAFVVLLVPRTIAQTSQGLSGTKTGLLIGLAVLLVGAGFLLRRPWGIGLGSALQVLLAAVIVLVPIFAVVVVFFLGIWGYLLQTRHQLVGTPAGWRMLVS